MQIQNGFGVSLIREAAPRIEPQAQVQASANPHDVLNLGRIEADLGQAQAHQAYMWQQFASKVLARDTAVAACLSSSRLQEELDETEKKMNAAAELTNRLGALYHVYKLGGLAALGRITVGWAEKDAREEEVIRTSITLG